MGIFDFLKRKDKREDELTGRINHSLPKPTRPAPKMPPIRSTARPMPHQVASNRMASPGSTRSSSDDGFATSAMLASNYSEPASSHHASHGHSCAPSPSYDSGGSSCSSSCDTGSSGGGDSGGGSCGGCD